MLANILDIDFAMRVASYSFSNAGLILFDFKAAFPGASQEFMWDSLPIFEVPADVIHSYRSFYYDNLQRVRFCGHLADGFAASSGFRQGCPLSPLLFAVVVDILLRRLCRLYVKSTVHAFADDIGIVVTNYKMLAGLLALFTEFAKNVRPPPQPPQGRSHPTLAG